MKFDEGNKIRISVVVTVHNSDRYLRDCIESVRTQTFSDIEIICMDGGSTDSSPQILQKFASEDTRIRIVNDENTSYGHKVNQGIRLARGKYISVLESDDMYLPDMLKCLYETAEQYNVDYVNADYLEFWEVDGRQYQLPVRMYPENDYNKVIKNKRCLDKMHRILRFWTGIFRKDFLIREKILMNESSGASFQDMSFRFLTSAFAETSYHMDVPVYLYRTDNPFSSVHDTKKVAVIADEFDFLKKELKRRDQNASIWRNFYIWKYNDFYGNLVRFNEQTRQELLERCYQELEMDNDSLERLNMKESSSIIEKFLDSSRKDMMKEIEDCFQALQVNKQRKEKLYYSLKDNKIVIFGCGRLGNVVLSSLYSVKNNICCFTDNNAMLWNTQKEGWPVLAPMVAVKKFSDALYIVANQVNGDDMARQLQSAGIPEEKIIVY